MAADVSCGFGSSGVNLGHRGTLNAKLAKFWLIGGHRGSSGAIVGHRGLGKVTRGNGGRCEPWFWVIGRHLDKRLGHRGSSGVIGAHWVVYTYPKKLV